MTIELTPVGVTCNLSCPYCYEHPMRDAGNYKVDYDLEKMKAALEAEGGAFTVFGGEPLLTPIEDLEEIFRWGLEKYGRNGVQTNGSLITDEHILLFEKYNVHVGISMDGPGALNDSRWAGSLEKTRKMTEQSLDAIDRLLAAGRPPSLIVTLYRGNGTAEALPELKRWLKELDSRGIYSCRIHLLEIDHEEVREKMALSDQENLDAMVELSRFEEELEGMRFDMFNDIRKLLVASPNSTTCVWNACDPYTTSAVQGVNGQGERSNCGRTNKEGVDWRKAEQPGYERQLALYHTPQEHGGCKGCRFFSMCKGECPGTGIGGDWRNRTEQCSIWMTLFEQAEESLLRAGQQPISLTPERFRIEDVLLKHWERGENVSIGRALQMVRSPEISGVAPVEGHGDAHGDSHGDSDEHGDAPHGDAPHGDSSEHGDAPHGDSWGGGK